MFITAVCRLKLGVQYALRFDFNDAPYQINWTPEEADDGEVKDTHGVFDVVVVIRDELGDGGEITNLRVEEYEPDDENQE